MTLPAISAIQPTEVNPKAIDPTRKICYMMRMIRSSSQWQSRQMVSLVTNTLVFERY